MHLPGVALEALKEWVIPSRAFSNLVYVDESCVLYTSHFLALALVRVQLGTSWLFSLRVGQGLPGFLASLIHPFRSEEGSVRDFLAF